MTSFAKLRYLENPGGFSKEDAIIEFSSGSDFQGGKPLKGVAYNIDLNSFAVFEAYCYDQSCFEGQGIWTTALTSSITQVINGTTYYWIECNADSKGFGWLIDIYSVCFDTGQMSLVERNLPINLDFTFSSKSALKPGLKIAVLKRLSTSSCEDMQFLYSQYNSPAFIKTDYSTLAPLLASFQTVQLEELAASLFLLSTSKDKQDSPNQKIFYIAQDKDLYLNDLIEKNLDKLVSLKDTVSISSRKNSIPSTLTTYITSDLLYKDALYLNPFINTFDEGCFDADCFAVENTPLLTSREVNNRAVAWSLISLIERDRFNADSKYTQSITDLSEYLQEQIDTINGLVYEGWTHSSNLNDSEIREEFLLSTSVISLLALFYAYSFLNIESLLLDLLRLSKAIEDKFLDPITFRFKDSLLENPTYSNAALVYGLLFSLITERSDLVERLLVQLEPHVNQTFGKYSEVLLRDGNDNLISNGDGGYVYQIIEPFDTQYLNQNPYEQGLLNYTTSKLSEIPVLDFLLASSIQICVNKKYTISNVLEQNLNVYADFLKTKNTLISQSFLLSDKALENCLSFLNVQALKKAEFFNTYIFRKIKSQIPVGFGWLTEALTESSSLYKLIQSITYVLTVWHISFYNRKSENRFESLIAGVSQTFEQTFNSFGVSYKVEELWKKILVFNSSEGRLKALDIEEGYLTGERYRSNSILIKVFQPINDRLFEAISLTKSVAAKVFFEETIQFKEELSLFNQSVCAIGYSEEENCNSFFAQDILLTEDGDCLVTEGSSLIEL